MLILVNIEPHKMVGILLITHDNLGETLLDIANNILGEKTRSIATLNVEHSMEIDFVVEKALIAIEQIENGEGVIILTDIIGATPFNIVRRLITPNKIESISGLNLPMLLRAITYQKSELSDLLKKAEQGGKDGVLKIQQGFSKSNENK
ncbi:MAG: PTS fructose transporter subunit IIA [Proteobacteria bacterium]|nr:PTS fructose transporter subunit IIA [Pseudomonadota bacterium]